MPSSQIHAVLREFLGSEAVKLKNLVVLYHALSKVQKTLKAEVNPDTEVKEALTLLLPVVQNLSELVKIVPAETEELQDKPYEATVLHCLRKNIGMDIAPAQQEESYDELGYKFLNYICSPIFTKIRLIAALLCTNHKNLSQLISKRLPNESMALHSALTAASVQVASNSSLVSERLQSELKKNTGISEDSRKTLQSIFDIFSKMAFYIGKYVNNITPTEDKQVSSSSIQIPELDDTQDEVEPADLNIPTEFSGLFDFLDALMKQIERQRTKTVHTKEKASQDKKPAVKGNMLSSMACKQDNILMAIYVLRHGVDSQKRPDFDKHFEKHLFDLALWICAQQAEKKFNVRRKRNAVELDISVGKSIEKLTEQNADPIIEDKPVLEKLNLHKNLFQQGFAKEELESVVIPLLQYTLALHQGMCLIINTPNVELVNDSHFRIPTTPAPVEPTPVEAAIPSSPRTLDLGETPTLKTMRKASTPINSPKSPRSFDGDEAEASRGRSSSAAGALLKTFRKNVSKVMRSISQGDEGASITISPPSSPRLAESSSVSTQSLFSSSPVSPRKGSDPLITELRSQQALRTQRAGSLDQESPIPATPKG